MMAGCAVGNARIAGTAGRNAPPAPLAPQERLAGTAEVPLTIASPATSVSPAAPVYRLITWVPNPLSNTMTEIQFVTNLLSPNWQPAFLGATNTYWRLQTNRQEYFRGLTVNK